MQGTARIAEHPEVAVRLQQHIDDIDCTIRQIRSAIFEIEIARSAGASLRRDVLDLVAESARVLGFEPAVYFDGPIDTLVPPDLATHLLPVLREAPPTSPVTPNATRVEITVRVDNDLSLDVIDNGTGGALPSGSGGNGVRNMTRRAQQLGGRALDISPGPGGGTRVCWVVPL